jgi:hypothetical protein
MVANFSEECVYRQSGLGSFQAINPADFDE